MTPVLINESAPALICTLHEQRANGTVALEGEVTTASEAAGHYRLRVKKTGPAGSTSTNQEGSFPAPAPSKSRVGHSTFSLEPGAHFEAVLTVQQSNRSAECRALGGEP
jgi:hypothetical protein